MARCFALIWGGGGGEVILGLWLNGHHEFDCSIRARELSSHGRISFLFSFSITKHDFPTYFFRF